MSRPCSKTYRQALLHLCVRCRRVLVAHVALENDAVLLVVVHTGNPHGVKACRRRQRGGRRMAWTQRATSLSGALVATTGVAPRAHVQLQDPAAPGWQLSCRADVAAVFGQCKVSRQMGHSPNTLLRSVSMTSLDTCSCWLSAPAMVGLPVASVAVLVLPPLLLLLVGAWSGDGCCCWSLLPGAPSCKQANSGTSRASETRARCVSPCGDVSRPVHKADLIIARCPADGCPTAGAQRSVMP